MADISGYKQFWIHEWIDSQPDGFLSGNVKHTIEHDVTLHPVSGSIHVIETQAVTDLEAKLSASEKMCEELAQFLTAIEKGKTSTFDCGCQNHAGVALESYAKFKDMPDTENKTDELQKEVKE